MSGVGEASAIIGIISLAGETIKASSKLYTFCKLYGNLDNHFTDIEKELENLKNDVRRIEGLSSVSSNDPSFQDELSKLGLTLAGCHKFIEQWTKSIAELDLENAKGRRAFTKKLKIAADRDYFRGIREEIANHRRGINTSLNILDVIVNFHSHTLVQTVEKKIQTVLEQQETLQGGFITGIKELTSKIEASCIFNPSSVVHRDEINSRKMNDTIEAVDARLRRIQRDLEFSLRRPPAPRKRRTRMSFRPQETGYKRQADPIDQIQLKLPNAQTIRIIKPGWLFQENHGRMVLSLLALDDAQYAAADFQQRISMVEQVKGMRLLIWLLRAQGFTSKLEIYLRRKENSTLLWAASLAYQWENYTFQNKMLNYGRNRSECGKFCCSCPQNKLYLERLIMERLCDQTFPFEHEDFQEKIKDMALTIRGRHLFQATFPTLILKIFSAMEFKQHHLAESCMSLRVVEEFIEWVRS